MYTSVVYFACLFSIYVAHLFDVVANFATARNESEAAGGNGENGSQCQCQI